MLFHLGRAPVILAFVAMPSDLPLLGAQNHKVVMLDAIPNLPLDTSKLLSSAMVSQSLARLRALTYAVWPSSLLMQYMRFRCSWTSTI